MAWSLRAATLNRVRNAFATQLEQGRKRSQLHVARALGMSPRSLQRRLEEADTSYREADHAQQRTVAVRLLTTTDKSVAQILPRRASDRWDSTPSSHPTTRPAS